MNYDYENPREKAISKKLFSMMRDRKNSQYFKLRFKGKYAGIATRYKSYESTILMCRVFIFMATVYTCFLISQNLDLPSGFKLVNVFWASTIVLLFSGIFFNLSRALCLLASTVSILTVFISLIVYGNVAGDFMIFWKTKILAIVIMGYLISGFFYLYKSNQLKSRLDQAIANSETY